MTAHSVSVVIPSLGGEWVDKTVATLNAGSVVPREILLCIPEREAARLDGRTQDNVRVVVSPVRGQVAQRALGFQQATSEYVLQVDDDVLVARDCLALLLDAMAQHPGRTAVAPGIYCSENGESMYKGPSMEFDFLRRTYRRLLAGPGGFAPGTITQNGGMVGIDPTVSGARIIEVEWIPGGCALHRRENLVLHNYFPFRGKAYYEDLLHSLELRKKGVRMFVDGRARCRTPCGGPHYIPTAREMFGLLRAQYHFVRRASLSVPRFGLYGVVTVAKFLARGGAR